MKARIRFAKLGVMKYVGHLDIMRYFQKAMRRAQIPIKYSEGFNPHQIMSFAAPLGVGITSEGEYMDIELKEMMDPKVAMDALNATMVEGMEILDFRYLPDGAANAMKSVAAASYLVTYKHPEKFDLTLSTVQQKLQEFYGDAPVIPIVKKTKKGERELDLKPLIHSFSASSDAEGNICFALTVSTGSVDNIKPELVLYHFHQFMGIPVEEGDFAIHRLDMFTLQDQNYVSLGEVGNGWK